MSQAVREIPVMEDLGFHPDTAACAENQSQLPGVESIRGVVSIGRTPVAWTLDIPLNLTSPDMTVFIPGFGGFKATSREPRRALAAEGNASLSYGPARSCGSSVVQRLLHSADTHVATLEAITDSVVHHEDAKKTLSTFGVNPLSQWLVSHSMGSSSGTPYAIRHPDRISGITHLGAVGYGSPTPLDLLRKLPLGIAPGIAHELMPYLKSGHVDVHIRSLFQALGYYAQDPIRTLGEARTCLTTDLRDDTKSLSDLHINTGYIAAEHDCLVTPPEGNTELFHHFGIMPGSGHLFPQLKAAVMARQVRRQQMSLGFDFAQQ